MRAWSATTRAAAALAAVAAALGLAGAARDGAPTRDRTPIADALVQRLSPAASLGAVVDGWGDAWASDRQGRRLLRLDGRSGRVVARIRTRGRVALAAGAGAVWALESSGGYAREMHGPLLRIDPRTSRVTARVPLRAPSGDRIVGFGVAADTRRVWVWGPSDVLEVDPGAARVRRRLHVGIPLGELTGAVPASGALLATTTRGRILRFGPAGGAEARPGPDIARAALAAVVPGRLALVSSGDLVGVDARTGRVDWRRPLGFPLGGVLVAGGVLLAHGALIGDRGDRVWAVDPASGRVLRSAVLPSFGSAGMALVRRALWITTAGGDVLVIPRPLADRLRSPPT